MDVATLADRITTVIPSLQPAHAIDQGFGLLIDDSGAPARRRAQARTTLLAEHVLTTTVAGSEERPVLMKGLEVAQLYPTTFSRPFRDVDLLVNNAEAVWRRCLDDGFDRRASDRADIDHHHLPALRAPFGAIGIDVHRRPNVPAWASLDASLVIDTAVPSRTGFAGILRPRDDIHALLMALHAWKSGFTRQRDLYDALLLAAASDIPVEQTAQELGLERCWRWTVDLAQTLLLDSPSAHPRLARLIVPRRPGIGDRRRVRLTAPFLVANPVRVVRGHYREYRLGREARRPGQLDS